MINPIKFLNKSDKTCLHLWYMKAALIGLLFSVCAIAEVGFTDKYGRVHDQEVENGNPSSDNGWLYSAVYKKLGGQLSLDLDSVRICVENLQRHPEKVEERNEVPISRDEILGLAYLGYLKPEHLDGWNFSPYKNEPFNLIKFVKQSLELVESFYPFELKHRTYFWEHNLKQINHVAFMVPLQDRHFILKQWGQYNMFYHLIHEIDSIIPSFDRSSRQIKFLKTGKDIQSVFYYYQDKNHPSVVKAMNKLGMK